MGDNKSSFEKYELRFIREYKKSFWFEIPETGNRIFIPKSQCKIETETFDLEEGSIYIVYVTSWIAEEKKISEGGKKEDNKIISIEVELIEDRPKAIKVKYIKENINFWLPKSQVINIKDFNINKEVYELKVAEWLVERKLKELNEEQSGRIIVNKTNVSSEMNNKPETYREEDIPF